MALTRAPSRLSTKSIWTRLKFRGEQLRFRFLFSERGRIVSKAWEALASSMLDPREVRRGET